MLTLKELIRDEETRKKYENVRALNIRSSIYDITNQCNLRCKGCFFFSSDQHKSGSDEKDIKKWEEFVLKEKARGVNNAILIGGEPALYLDRVEAFYKHIRTYCASNGIIKIPKDRFPNMMVGISLWGNDDHQEKLRGVRSLEISLKNYSGHDKCYYLYTLTPGSIPDIEPITKKIGDHGLKVHYQLFSNDEGVNGFDFAPGEKEKIRDKMDEMLDKYPDVVISAKYYHKVLTENKLFGRPFRWEECPSVSLDRDDRDPETTKRLIGFQSYASDLKTVHRCCTSDTRDCTTCNDGAAKMSWIIVNKREHMKTPEDFKNWIEVTEMFAKLYQYVPW